MSIAISKFITDLAVHFPPKHARPELEATWLKSMAEALRGTAPKVLEEAARHLINTRKYNSFPLPAECRAVCMEIAERQELRQNEGSLPGIGFSYGLDWTQERRNLASQLICGALGKEAAKDGWILALWNFCREKQRLPSGAEIHRCKAVAREFDQLYALTVQGKAGPWSSDLEKLGASMLKKRKELSDVAHGRAG